MPQPFYGVPGLAEPARQQRRRFRSHAEHLKQRAHGAEPRAGERTEENELGDDGRSRGKEQRKAEAQREQSRLEAEESCRDLGYGDDGFLILFDPRGPPPHEREQGIADGQNGRKERVAERLGRRFKLNPHPLGLFDR